MMNVDVAGRQEVLQVEAEAYWKSKEAESEARIEKAETLGPLAAADREAAIAHARHATVAEGRFEAQIASDDKAPVNFLSRGLRAARAVCRLVDFGRTHLGTGFLVAPGLLITNAHVLPDALAAREALAEFDYELDADEAATPVRRFALDPDRLFVASSQDALDFALVAVREVGEDGRSSLSEQGWLPLDGRRHKILEGQPTIVLQHPDGQMKQICLFESQCTFRDDVAPYILYSNDTDFGSSGSPVFNRHWQVVALHQASVETDARHKGAPVIQNRGIRISAILESLATTSPQTREALAAPAVLQNGRPQAGTAVHVPTDDGTALEGRTVIRLKPVGSRDGYDPDFLGGGARRIGLEAFIPAWMGDDLTRLIGGEAWELRYQHFSLAMSKSRKLALFTAVNVDGAALQRLDRKDRDPDRPLPGLVPEAASDRWQFDDRIPLADQLGAELYDQTSFDFGHLVRRLDAVWSPDPADQRTPRIANDDTFYMTNCAPHEVRWHRTGPINRDQVTWSALEDLVLNQIKEDGRRASVFTGPVLDPRDRPVLGVKIPRAFWKIVAWSDDETPRAAGFLLWQSQEVDSVVIRESAFRFAPRAGPMPIRDIARLTSLDFGPLFAADVL